jgi:hypothetical protein
MSNGLPIDAWELEVGPTEFAFDLLVALDPLIGPQARDGDDPLVQLTRAVTGSPRDRHTHPSLTYWWTHVDCEGTATAVGLRGADHRRPALWRPGRMAGPRADTPIQFAGKSGRQGRDRVDGPPNQWQEGPSLTQSIFRYKWLVALTALIGLLAAYGWSSRQPARYEGVVRVFVDSPGQQLADPGRIVRTEGQFLTSPVVLDEAVALTNGRLTRRELEKQLTVEPANDADVITIRVLDATPQGAAQLADAVARAYQSVAATQAKQAASQTVAALDRTGRQLEADIVRLNDQLRARPGTPLLTATRDAKLRQLQDIADQKERSALEAARASRAGALRETAAVPLEPSQPKPVRAGAIGAMLGVVLGAALAWWLTERQLAAAQKSALQATERDGSQRGRRLDASLRRIRRLPDGAVARPNGSPAGNGFGSGIVDFEQLATSVQQLFQVLDGPRKQLYESDIPQLTAEEASQRLPVDATVVLLESTDGGPVTGSVGVSADQLRVIEQHHRDLIDDTVRDGPSLVGDGERGFLADARLGGDEAESIALTPLVYDDRIGFGVLLAVRRRTGKQASALGDWDLEELTSYASEVASYLWAWLQLRDLKLRLGVMQ